MKIVRWDYLYLILVIVFYTPSEIFARQWGRLPIQTDHWVNAIGTQANDVFISTYDNQISNTLRSLNGLPWEEVNNGLDLTRPIENYAFCDSLIFAVGIRGIFRSSDSGNTWINKRPLNQAYYSITWMRNSQHDTTFIFAGTLGAGIYRSVNFGENWQFVNTGLTQKSIASFAVEDTHLFAASMALGFDKGGIFLSTNYGASWQAKNVGLTDTSIQVLALTPFGVLAGTHSAGVFISTNYGENWSAVNNGLSDLQVLSITSSGSAVFVGTHDGVFSSNDSCSSWEQINTGFSTGQWIYDLSCTSSLIYASTYPDKGLWVRALSGLVSVDSSTQIIPHQFRLEQNYPNPFNPWTHIQYSLSEESYVTLKIFDGLGREVSSLVEDFQPPGQKVVQFDGSTLPSGVYYYRLVTDSFSDIKRLLLIK